MSASEWQAHIKANAETFDFSLQSGAGTASEKTSSSRGLSIV
ncbi:hypothetical protein [Thermoactinomyces mirandus]|nr:hypothetical protein [Thermoactinomyces mirandus]